MRTHGLVAALALAACTDRPAAVDATVAAVDAIGTDGVADGSATSVPRSLDPVSVGDLTVTASSDGAFTLRVGNRTILSSPAGPLASRTFDQRVRSTFGIWSFARTNVREVRPSAGATLLPETDGATLSIHDGAATASLRFARLSPGEVTLRTHLDVPSRTDAQVLRFVCDADAHFLGFGEQYNALDHRGEKLPLWVSEQGIGRDPALQTPFSGDHSTTYFPVPFFLDPRGLGLAIETDARVETDLCATDANEFALAPEQSGDVTVQLYVGPTVSDVMRDWTRLQGRASAPPRWAVDGAWIGVQGGAANIDSAVQAALDANVPVSAVWVQDWLGARTFGPSQSGVKYHWSVDPDAYPDLAGEIASLRTRAVHFLGYFNPFVVPELELYATAAAQGFLPLNAAGMPYTFPINVLTGSEVDLANPAAVDWFRGYARTAVSLGMSGWMQDFGEWLPYDAVLHGGLDPRTAHNRYPQAWHAAARAELEAAHSDGDFVLLTRSGWLGEATVAQVVWAGDQEASWSVHDGLPTVIPAVVSLGLAGIAYVTCDIGGFSGGPSTRELYERWTELAAFLPVFRTHEGLMRGTNWSWHGDAETLAHFSRFARIHRLLADRIVQLGAIHANTGLPIVRALALQFPDDRATYNLLDEFMLGDDLLVAPVVAQGAVQRRVHLPAGTWFDVWDPTRSFTGPADVTVDAPVGRPPVFSTVARSDLAAVH